jgi:hypothetical protein
MHTRVHQHFLVRLAAPTFCELLHLNLPRKPANVAADALPAVGPEKSATALWAASRRRGPPTGESAPRPPLAAPKAAGGVATRPHHQVRAARRTVPAPGDPRAASKGSRHAASDVPKPRSGPEVLQKGGAAALPTADGRGVNTGGSRRLLEGCAAQDCPDQRLPASGSVPTGAPGGLRLGHLPS